MNFKRIYEFWDVKITRDTGMELICTCPFCNKEKHFYINSVSGMYDCQRCNSTGNVYTFLNKIYENLLVNKDDELLRSLARLKYVSYLKLKEWGIVPIKKNEYIIPYFNENGKISTLKKYPLGKKGLFTPELKTNLYGLHQLFDPGKRGWPVFVSEAEFNAISLDWFFQKIDYNAICIANHGTFNKDCIEYLQGWPVYICLDNDIRAKQATVKLADKLRNKTTSLNVLMWPEDTPNKYDIRDFIKDYVILPKDYEGGRSKLFSYFREIKGDSLGDIQRKNIPVCSYEEVIQELSKSIKLSPNFTNAFKLSLATVISMQVPGKRPVWLFLVGPPGCGKSTICTSFRLAINNCVFQSSIHAKGLVSGWSGRTGFDPSLIPKLNKKTLVLQDFTEVLAKSNQEKGEIFSILRGIYDGYLQRSFGQGTTREYYSSFAIVSGVTRSILAENTAGLGERFIRFNMYSTASEAYEQQGIAMTKDLEGDECDLNVQKKIVGFMENKYDVSLSNLKALIPDWFIQKLQALTTLVAILRTPVERHLFGRMQHEVIYEPDVERGSRLAVQFQRLAASLAYIEDKEEIDEEIYNLLKQVGRNSVNSFILKIVDFLYTKKDPVLVSTMNFGVILNNRVTIKFLQDLEVIGTVISNIKNTQLSFQLAPNIHNLIKESEFAI